MLPSEHGIAANLRRMHLFGCGVRLRDTGLNSIEFCRRGVLALYYAYAQVAGQSDDRPSLPVSVCAPIYLWTTIGNLMRWEALRPKFTSGYVLLTSCALLRRDSIRRKARQLPGACGELEGAQRRRRRRIGASSAFHSST